VGAGRDHVGVGVGGGVADGGGLAHF
jgi:hypothetical protein